MLHRFVTGLVVLLATSCAPATFQAKRFQSDVYPYAVSYTNERTKALAGPNWRIDNYRRNNGKFERKKGGDYQVQRGYDDNNDGEIDRREKEPFYDILLEHRGRDAALWLRTTPISKTDQDKELSVFAERYVESVAGSGVIAVHFGTEVTRAIGKRYASRVIGRSACEVAEHPAYVIDFEVANVDQLQLAETSRWSRGRLAIVQTGFETPPYGDRQYPVLMLVGLSAAPADFDALVPEFDDFLGRIAIGPDGERAQTSEWPSGHTCKPKPLSPAAPRVVPAWNLPEQSSGGEAPISRPQATESSSVPTDE